MQACHAKEDEICEGLTEDGVEGLQQHGQTSALLSLLSLSLTPCCVENLQALDAAGTNAGERAQLVALLGVQVQALEALVDL